MKKFNYCRMNIASPIKVTHKILIQTAIPHFSPLRSQRLCGSKIIHLTVQMQRKEERELLIS